MLRYASYPEGSEEREEAKKAAFNQPYVGERDTRMAQELRAQQLENEQAIGKSTATGH
jgi:hypothetical protein